jgi:AcrR family transcriptional regulator
VARLAKGIERQEIVVAAAARAIADIGIANVRVADIAERANMTTGHVSYYFPNKEALLLLAIRRSEQLLIDTTRAALSAIEDPRERLRELIEQASARGPMDEGWILWLQVWANGFADGEVSEEHRFLDQRWFELLIEVLEQGRAVGAFTFEDLLDTAETLSALIDGLSIQLTVGSTRMDRDRLLRLCTSACDVLLGVAKR